MVRVGSVDDRQCKILRTVSNCRRKRSYLFPYDDSSGPHFGVVCANADPINIQNKKSNLMETIIELRIRFKIRKISDKSEKLNSDSDLNSEY